MEVHLDVQMDVHMDVHVDVQREDSTLVLDLPEGLLDVYLGNAEEDDAEDDMEGLGDWEVES